MAENKKQEESKFKYNILPNNQVEFEVDVRGTDTGTLYKGKIVAKLFLTLKERREVAAIYSRLDAGNEKDFFMRDLNLVCAELSKYIVSGPDWLKPDDLDNILDINPLFFVWDYFDNIRKEIVKK